MAHIKEIVADVADQQDQEQAHARIRQQALEAATRGRQARIHPDLIARAFEGHADDFSELQRRMRAAREAKAARQRADDQRVELRVETERVLAEWDAQRRAAAEAAARRRLGRDAA